MTTFFPNVAFDMLRSGRLALGFGINQFRTPVAVHIAKSAGYQWLAIDMEHGGATLQEVSQICLTALPLGISPIVRIAAGAYDEGTRALDNGAQGLIVPHIETAEEAAYVVERFRYSPLGRRGWGGGAPQFGYAPPALDEAQKQLNDGSLLVLLIESEQSVDEIENLAGVDGIDALMIGASDLSIAFGVPGTVGHPSMKDAFQRVSAACRAHGKIFGMGGVYDEFWARSYIEMGARLVAGGADQGFLHAAARARAKFLMSLNSQ